MGRDDFKALVISPAALALLPAPGSPTLSCASTEALQEVEIVDELGAVRNIYVPTERPLTIWLDGSELVTLMTLGAAPEWLVLGYLRNQRLRNDITAIESVRVDWESASVRVLTRDASGAHRVPNLIVAGAACALGSVFGDAMRNGLDLKLPSVEAARISRSVLLDIVQCMRVHDDIHRAAGSVHSCAVFRSAQLWVSVEDVSRHNGVDTITGWMALYGVSGADKILFTTGRLTAEIVMKAAFNGIPILVSRNGVTAMGRQLAVRLGMTLIGRAANQRYICYAGTQRFDSAS